MFLRLTRCKDKGSVLVNLRNVNAAQDVIGTDNVYTVLEFDNGDTLDVIETLDDIEEALRSGTALDI